MLTDYFQANLKLTGSRECYLNAKCSSSRTMGTAYCWWGSAAICKFRKTFFFNWKEQNVEVKETLLMVKLNKKFRSTVFMSRRSSNAPAFTATRGGTTGFSTTSPHQPLSSRRSRKLAGNNSKFCWIPKLLPSLWISEHVLLRLESSVLIFFLLRKDKILNL